MTKAALDPVNMPPNNPAYSTPITTFLCPSARATPTVVYSAELANSFNNFGITVSLAAGLIFGRTDYAPTPAWRRTSRASASMPALDHLPTPGRPGAHRQHHRWHVEHDHGRRGRGRPGWYGSQRPRRRCPATRAASRNRHRKAEEPGPTRLNYIATNGSDPSGSGIAAGGGFMGMPAAPWTCANGCSNDSEIFAFHPGGSNALFGDGSVRFVRNGLTMNQMQALLSRAGGEVITFDY